jgi:tRNA pseudouridine55 synthase
MTSEEILAGSIILVDKPLTWSSFQAVNKLKYLLKRKFDLPKKFKIGHAGTLDPAKEYTGTIILGATTPSYDLETEINAHFPTDHLTVELIAKTTEQFIGEIDQKPPVFSAIKKDGKRLYELARAGEEIEIQARKTTIYEFQITRIQLPEVDFRITCSKGTYIRSIAYDFGLALQSGGHLSALRRTKIGDYNVINAVTPAEFEKLIHDEI